MNTATSGEPTCLVRNGVRLLTAADVAVLPDYLPSGNVRYELHDGVLVLLAPLMGSQSRCLTPILAKLVTCGEDGRHGVAMGRVGVLIRRDPDHLLAPPAAFLTTAQLPPMLSPEGCYLLTVPALVVEVRSKNDTDKEIDEKVRDYLGAGSVLVWVADPETRTVTAYRANQEPAVFGPADTLTADGVIPGFAVPIANLLPA